MHTSNRDIMYRELWLIILMGTNNEGMIYRELLEKIWFLYFYAHTIEI